MKTYYYFLKGSFLLSTITTSCHSTVQKVNENSLSDVHKVAGDPLQNAFDFLEPQHIEPLKCVSKRWEKEGLEALHKRPYPIFLKPSDLEKGLPESYSEGGSGFAKFYSIEPMKNQFEEYLVKVRKFPSFPLCIQYSGPMEEAYLSKLIELPTKELILESGNLFKMERESEVHGRKYNYGIENRIPLKLIAKLGGAHLTCLVISGYCSIEEIASLSEFSALQRLRLRIRAGGADGKLFYDKILPTLSILTNLTHLHLDNEEGGDVVLSRSCDKRIFGKLHKLKWLSIPTKNGLYSEELEEIATLKDLEYLCVEWLKFWENPPRISDEATKKLLNLSKLSWLRMARGQFTSQGLRILFQLKEQNKGIKIELYDIVGNKKVLRNIDFYRREVEAN